MVMNYRKLLTLVVVLICANTFLQAQDESTKPVKPTAAQVAEKQASKEYQKQLKSLTKGTTTSALGLQYKITNKTDGIQAKNGDIVKVHYTGKLVDGTVFDSSIGRGQPLTLLLGVGMVIKGWDEGIAMLKVGEKATFVIPGDLAYGEGGSGVLIGPNETLVFDVELVDIVQTTPYETEGIEAKTTASGLKYYVLESNPEGKVPTKGKKVTVHYSGYLEDGKKFDTSWNARKYFQPLVFQLGVGQVIKGWDEGVALMKTGEIMKFVIPANLAYGEKGYPGAIPPNATLTFDVELVDAE